MYTTSTEWKEDQKEALTSESFIEIAYKIGDPNLQDFNADDNERLCISDVTNLLNDVECDMLPYATLERDFWKLDGSMKTVSELTPQKDSGFISKAVCDNNGLFNPKPIISISFINVVKSKLPGLTIKWGTAFGEYPTKFTIKTLDEHGVEVGEYKYDKDNENIPPPEMISFPMSNFKKIEIEIIKWNRGNRRVRVEKIIVGISKVYKKKDLLSFSCTEGIDPISSSLPKYEIAFEVDNTNDEFNPQKPDKQGNLAEFMMERQELTTRYGYLLDGGMEWIPGGVYYLSEWNAPQNGLSASFKARDLFGFLNAPYYKGEFPENGETSLLSLAKAVLEEANLPEHRSGGNPWVLDEKTLDAVKTNAPLPICSLGECLQLIANAACCVIYFDRNGKLHIEAFKDAIADLEINDKNSYTKPEVNLIKPIKQIDVSQFSYVADKERKTLYEGVVALSKDTDVVIEFSDIAKNIEVVFYELDTDESGSTSKKDDSATSKIDGVNVKNYAKCSIFNSENDNEILRYIQITGIAQKSAERIVTIQNDYSGETQTLKNTLIASEERAGQVGEWVQNYLNLRKHMSVDWRIDPRLDVMDIINVASEKDSDKKNEPKMLVTSNSFSYNGAFKGKSEGVIIK